MGPSRLSTTRAISVLLVFALVGAGCAGSKQSVEFRNPAGAKVHISRSVWRSMNTAFTAPHEAVVKRGRIFPIKIRFPEKTMVAMGFSAREAALLNDDDRDTLRGGIVCPALPEGADKKAVVHFELDGTALRSALGSGAPLHLERNGPAGHLRAVLVVSVAGAALDDPLLAPHGKPITKTATATENVGAVATVVVVFLVVVAVGSVIALAAALA